MPDPDALALRVGLRGVPNTQPAVYYPAYHLYGAVKGEGGGVLASLCVVRVAASRRQSLLC